MKKWKRNLVVFALLVVTSLVVYYYKNCDVKFNAGKWKHERNVGNNYKLRNRMVNDLVKSKYLEDKTYQQIINSLGVPENIDTSRNGPKMFYLIYTLLEEPDQWDLYSPRPLNELHLEFNMDSIFNDYEIRDVTAQAHWDW